MSPFRLAFAIFVLVFSITGIALADSTIKSDTAHTHYFFEAEPHFVVTPFDEGGIGAGFAGTFIVADEGFIKRVNDSVGVGFGANWATNRDFILSGAMQWNFWFTEHWSAFGEPGIAFDTHDHLHLWPSFGAGGRYAFTDRFTLTLRLGFPVSSVGLSFLL
ncbi:MAG TPA: hypothetical protein VF103_00280 [Polyangiaceae bacterium]